MGLNDWINGTTNFRDPYAFNPWPVDLISPKVTRFDGLEAGERQFLTLSDLPGDAASGHSRINVLAGNNENKHLVNQCPANRDSWSDPPVADCYQKFVDVAAICTKLHDPGTEFS